MTACWQVCYKGSTTFRVDKKRRRRQPKEGVSCAFYLLEMDFVELDAASGFWQPCHFTSALAWA